MSDAMPSLGVVLEGPSRCRLQGLHIQGLQQGFRVGFQYGRCHCTGASANMQSVVRQPEVIGEYLAREVRLGRVMGPLEPGR